MITISTRSSAGIKQKSNTCSTVSFDPLIFYRNLWYEISHSATLATFCSITDKEDDTEIKGEQEILLSLLQIFSQITA